MTRVKAYNNNHARFYLSARGFESEANGQTVHLRFRSTLS